MKSGRPSQTGKKWKIVVWATTRKTANHHIALLDYLDLRLQEEERERRLDFVPEVSALDQDTIYIDTETRDLLESLGHGGLTGVSVRADGH